MVRLILEAVKEWVEELLETFEATRMGYVTPKMFGAKGDGVADDTLAIKTALESGGTVFFPKGTYRVQARSIFLNPEGDFSMVGDNARIEFFMGEVETSRIFTIRSVDGACKKLNISGIDFVWNIDENDYVISYQYDIRVIYILGQYEEINIDNVTVRAGGTGNVLHRAACLWAECGCNKINVTNSLFENFTNTEAGGCIWINPSTGTDYNEYYDIYNVNIFGNECRHTTIDEAIGVWIRENDTHMGLHNVTIDSNTLIHKDWNGTCHANSNLISVNSHAPLDINCTISNNILSTDKSVSVGLIKNKHVSAIIENNTFIFDGAASGHTMHQIISELYGKATFRNNIVRCNISDPNSILLLSSSRGDLEAYGNTIISNVNFRIDNDDTQAEEGKLLTTVFKNNFVNCTNEATIQIRYVKDANVQRTVRILDNMLSGKFYIFPQHNPIEIIGNTFNYLSNTTYRYFIQLNGGASLVWKNNKNITLVVSTGNLTAKLENFEFEGAKDEFDVSHSAALVSDFFDSYTIKYIGNALMETSSLPPALGKRKNATYVLTGNQAGYQIGGIYKCVQVTGSDPATYEWKLVNDPSISNQFKMPTDTELAELPNNSAFLTDMQTKVADTSVSDYVIKVKDMVTNGYFYIGVANGKLVGFTEAQLNQAFS